MKSIALRFLLKAGHVVDAVLPQDEAERVLTNWQNGVHQKVRGVYTLRDSKTNKDVATIWCVDLAEVQGCISLNLEQQTSPQAPPGVAPAYIPNSFGAGSGL